MSKRRPRTRRVGPQPSLSLLDYPKDEAAPSGTADSTSTTTATSPSGQVQPPSASTNPPSGIAVPSNVPEGHRILYSQMKTNFGRALAMMEPDELRRVLDESLKPPKE
ncbi:hypothetical protein FRC01_004209 [Tulasnella sp. 417]|nr:hypothetical protein FRC01_004209 [Tulasnella sp. 417]